MSSSTFGHTDATRTLLSSVAERAKAIYEAEYRQKLESKNCGEFAAIEPESREVFVAKSFVVAALKAKETHPTRKSFVLRIGYDAAVHLGL